MKERRAALLMLSPAALFVGVLLLFPIALAVFTSLHVDDVVSPRRFVGLANYREMLRDPVAGDALGFTLLFVGVSTTAEVVLGLGIALVLDGLRRGKGVVRAAVLVPWAIPTVVAAVIWKYIWNDQYGLVNLILFDGHLGSWRAWLTEVGGARTAIVVADVWKTTAFPALILLAGLQAIPSELHEAARVDGAGATRRFFSITLPLLRPALLVAVLFRLMDAFRVFDLVYVMTQGAPGDATNVLSFYGYQKMFPEQRLGYGCAVSTVVFLLAGVVSVLLVAALGRRRAHA